MKKYLAPLGIFLGGSIMAVLAFVLLPAIGTAGDNLATATSSYESNFWGFSWIVGSVEFWVFFIIEMLVLVATFKAFLKVR